MTIILKKQYNLPAKHDKWSILCSRRSKRISAKYVSPEDDVCTKLSITLAIASSNISRATRSLPFDCINAFNKYS